jgi:hypothetical protein
MLTGEKERMILKDARARYSQAMDQGMVNFDVDGSAWKPEQNFDLWIHGCYFHDDNDKARQLAEQMKHPTSELMSRHSLMELLVEVTRYLVRLVNLILNWRSRGVLTI